MKNRLFNRLSTLEVFDNDSLEKRRRYLRIPDSFRVHDDDWPVAAHAEARSLASLYALWSEEQVFSLEELGEHRIELAAAPVG
jgi:hypothetical protein